MGTGILSSRKRKIGAPPGTPVHLGAVRDTPVTIDVFVYDAHQCEERSDVSVQDAVLAAGMPGVTWINVDGVHSIEPITRLCSDLGVHSLIQEDIVNTDQRPKADVYDSCLYCVARMVHQTNGTSVQEQVSIVVLPGVVISFQEAPGDVFTMIRTRLRQGKGQIRRNPADYLAYCLLDAMADNYYLLLERLEEEIEPLEARAMEDPDPLVARDIQILKREILMLRRSLWPLREMVHHLSRDEHPLISEGTRVYLRDLYDHVIHLIEILETFQEMVAGTMEMFLSSISNRMNSVMKVLTIISTIFIPLTFIAGVYGMNFAHMPELDYPWAYPATLGVMGATALLMIRFFRRRGWL